MSNRKRETNLANIGASYSFNNTLTHHAERPQGPEYLDNEYQKSSSAFRDFWGTILMFTIRFTLTSITVKCLDINSRLFPNIFTAFCLAAALYIFKFKKHKVAFAILTFITSFLVMFPLDYVFDSFQDMANVFYWELETLQAHEVSYRIGRLILGIIFVLIFRKKYAELNDNSNKNVYSAAETITYRLTCAMFLFAPFCTFFELLLRMTGLNVLVFTYSFVCLIIILLVLTRILLGIKNSSRIDDRYGLAAFVFAVLSIYEIIYVTLI
jgi:hypothetical protein